MHCQLGRWVVVGAMKSRDQGLLHPASLNLVELGSNPTGARRWFASVQFASPEQWFAWMGWGGGGGITTVRDGGRQTKIFDRVV